MSDPVVLLSTGDVVGPAGGVTDDSMVLFSGTSGKLIKGNNAVVTAAGLALLDDVDAAAQRTTLGLGTAATSNKQTAKYDATAGSVLTVGAFGLGGAQEWITYNLDTLVNTGVYYCTNSSTNTPRSDFGHLQVYGGADVNWCVQIYDCVTTGAVRYIRYLTAGAWSGWKEVALTDSPAFIGTPTAPTAPAGTNTTQLANTAFVKAAVDAAPMLGVGQTWQDVTSKIIDNTNRTNITGRPIEVVISGGRSGAPGCEVYVDGILLATWTGSELDELSITFTLPQGSYYKIVNRPQYIFTVVELR